MPVKSSLQNRYAKEKMLKRRDFPKELEKMPSLWVKPIKWAWLRKGEARVLITDHQMPYSIRRQ